MDGPHVFSKVVRMQLVTDRGGTLFTKGGQFPLVYFVRGTIFTSEYCPGGHFSWGDTIPSDNGSGYARLNTVSQY